MATAKEKKLARSRAWHDAHPGYGHAWTIEHREEHNLWSRIYRETHHNECLAYERAYREAHREECRAKARAYGKSHPEVYAEKCRRRLALKRGATVGSIDLDAIKVRDRMRCCICGERVKERLKYPHPDSLSFDHSHPLSLGGPHSQENQRVAHLHCNLERSAGRLPVQMVLC